MKEDIKQATEEGAYDRVAELAEQLKSMEARDGALQKMKEEIKQATEEGAYDRVAELARNSQNCHPARIVPRRAALRICSQDGWVFRP